MTSINPAAVAAFRTAKVLDTHQSGSEPLRAKPFTRGQKEETSSVDGGRKSDTIRRLFGRERPISPNPSASPRPQAVSPYVMTGVHPSAPPAHLDPYAAYAATGVYPSAPPAHLDPYAVYAATGVYPSAPPAHLEP